MFVTIVTAFGLRSNQSRRVPDAMDQRERPARIVLGGPKPDVVKLLQRRANGVSCQGVARCSVDPGLRKVRLSPGSDRIADDSADSGLCHIRTSRLTQYRRQGQTGIERQSCHSMTSLARARIAGGIVRPNAWAVLRLMTKSNLAGP
jgi:hypothetical protein